jgi:NADPH:quinone reductase-like Zn-dependent oxidoreductase
MKAIVYTKYGPPSKVLELKEVEKPTPKDNEVLVKIFAASINDGDKSMIRGKPIFIRLMGFGLLKPKHTIPGGDIAGQVEAVGRDVKQFQPGDEVFGDIGAVGHGAFAEYVSVPENVLALKPVNLTYEEAAAFPQYALVALQGLRDNGQIQHGQKVLINGASGGVGTFAVQVAKSYGAEVTGVCSTRNLDLVRSLGADHVIDYTEGKYVAVAFNVRALISMSGNKVSQLSHEPNVKDLVFMKELIEAGKVVPVIDRRYPLSENVVEAFRYFEEGHPRGKVVITVEHSANA